MDRETKIACLELRKQMLLQRGPHNLKLAAKLQRKIYKLQQKE